MAEWVNSSLVVALSFSSQIKTMAASATLSLCSLFATHCKISQNLQTPSSNVSFLSLSSSSSSHKLSSSSSRPTFPLLTKSAEAESAVVVEAEFQASESEAKPDDTEPAALQVVEAPSSPKREQLFGVVMVCIQFQFIDWIYGYPDVLSWKNGVFGH